MKLLEQILGRRNVEKAIQQVKRNGGSAGVDGMKVEALEEFFSKNYQTIATHIRQ